MVSVDGKVLEGFPKNCDPLKPLEVVVESRLRARHGNLVS
jgi:hypothetical protein